MKIVELLNNFKMVGQVYPWHKLDETEPVLALLVPISAAMAEYTGLTGQEITRNDFIKLLKANGVLVFNNIEEFVKYRAGLAVIERERKKTKNKTKRNLSEERRNQLKNQAISMRAKKGKVSFQNPL
jgi:hypothetical protein